MDPQDTQRQAFVERVCAEVLSEQQREALALDAAEQREVAARIARQAEASTRAGVLASEGGRLAQHYEHEARLLQEVLDTAGLPLDSLSSRAQLAAQLIASVCSTLGVARPALPEITAAWAQLKLRESRAAVLQAKLRRHNAELESDAARAKERLDQLRTSLARVQQQQAASERRVRAEGQQVAELEAKQQEYLRSLDKCARKLAANGVTPEIHHSTIVERSAALQELQAHAEELQAQLDTFHNLPASLLGANMMLQQARERLAAAQERLESGLADL